MCSLSTTERRGCGAEQRRREKKEYEKINKRNKEKFTAREKLNTVE